MVIDHPDWIVSLSFDGFGSHVNVTEALDIFKKHNIRIIKEEAATSHINQAYDQVVAKQDKAARSQLLDFVRSSLKTRIDPWQIVGVLIAATRKVTKKAWIASFRMVNMHPNHRLPFDKWIDKIKEHVTVGELKSNEKKKS